MLTSQDQLVHVCRPTFFYNISQRHSFIVNDLRPTKSDQRLKNTFKINSITYQNDLNNIKATQELQQYTSDPDNEGIKILFQQRKRIFNFFLPFDASDSFSIYLSDQLYKIDEEQDNHFHDYFSIPLNVLEKLCNSYRTEIKDGLINSKRAQQAHKDQLKENYIISSPSLYESQQSPSPLKKLKRGFSTPNLVEYDVLVSQILYLLKEQEITNIEVFSSLLRVLRIYKQEKIRETYIIFEPAKIMFNYYPLLDYCLPKNKKFLDKTLPNEIVEGKMYLGNADHSMNEDLLVKCLKITHIVNAAQEVKNALTGVIYLKISILDEVTEKIFEHFDAVYSFIDAIWDDDDSRVLIHCAQGRSRSATLVIMFLMKKYQWSLDVAHTYVKERREVVSVNDGFMTQLQNYELQLVKSQVG